MSQCMQLRSDLVIPDHIEIIDTNALYACQNITGFECGVNSKLHTLGRYSLQLLSRCKYIVLSPSLTSIGDSALSGCVQVENLTFLGETAPTIKSNSFGSDANNWTGAKIQNTTMYVPSNSTGYESDDWMVLYDESRTGTNSSNETCYGYFNLSKTL